MESLRDRIEELQSETEIFANFCDFVDLAHGSINLDSDKMRYYRKLLSTAIRMIRNESHRIEKESDAILDEILTSGKAD